jgi:UDP-N-acetylglucosamine diphosphorylase/glucosamine-1-phosphate N-acetyltransferase
MRVCLFEDGRVANLEPLTLTRPAFELLCGLTSLGHKQCRYFGCPERGVWIRTTLVDVYRLQQPATPVNDPAWLQAAPTILVNARWLPPSAGGQIPSTPGIALVDDEVAWALVEPHRLASWSSQTLENCLETWKRTLPLHQVGGRVVQYLWDLVEQNGEQIAADCRKELSTDDVQHSHGISVVGPVHQLYVDAMAHVDPMVVADTRSGPVVIGAEAVITAFTRLEGPCAIGSKTQVLGGKIRAGTTLGPQCRVGGEVEASILQGCSNKYHDGFLGHSYLGEWVNFGAGSSNSDLRNDYGEVTVTVDGAPVKTGLSKVGCFVGDHTKTGLGTLLNTGTNVGVFCNLLPSGGLLPKFVPSFCNWWNGLLVENTDPSQLLATAAIVMQRRNCTLTQTQAAYFRALCADGAAERRWSLREAELRRLRRSA